MQTDEDWEKQREDFQRGRDRTEQSRMAYCDKKLRAIGCEISDGPDKKSFRVEFKNGNQFNFWPHTGWFAGPTQGRGLANLLKAGGHDGVVQGSGSQA